MKALVGAFNQEKALVGAFSVIVQLHRLKSICGTSQRQHSTLTQPPPHFSASPDRSPQLEEPVHGGHLLAVVAGQLSQQQPQAPGRHAAAPAGVQLGVVLQECRSVLVQQYSSTGVQYRRGRKKCA